jgi:hypothetical protein
MIVGIFRFIFVKIPLWIYDCGRDFFDWLGNGILFLIRVVVRLVRVTLIGGLWFALVFGPVIASLYLDWPFPDNVANGLKNDLNEQPFRIWHIASAGWALVGMAGSIWGLNRVVKHRRSFGIGARA